MSAPTTTQLSAGTWAIDPVHSSIHFRVRHLMVSKVRGKFDVFNGAVTIGAQGEPAVRAEIDVNSVNTGNDQRDSHLRSADFFDVEQYPTATFQSTSVQPQGDGYALQGDFTLKGVTRPVALDLKFAGVSPGMGQGEVAGFEAGVVINRKDFGIDIDMPLEGGGVVVGDDITITLFVEAVKQA